MRDIRFRAWDERENKMYLDVQSVYDSQPEGSSRYFEAFGQFIPDGGWYESGSFRLMQFTGLKDELGSEIWEGDIVSSPRFENLEVKWEVYGWEPFCLILDGDYADKNHYFKVIGNIYEHPNLLK